MNDVDINERIALILRESREKANVSQDYIAKKLNISKKSVQNYEASISVPNVKMIIKWFEAVDVPIYPYMFQLSHPELIALNANSSDAEVRNALISVIQDMDINQMRQHFFEMFGEHGTAPKGMGEVKTAYLHLPMYVKIGIAEIISTQFEIAEARGELVQPDKIMPDKEALKEYIEKAKKAVIEGKDTYL